MSNISKIAHATEVLPESQVVSALNRLDVGVEAADVADVAAAVSPRLTLTLPLTTANAVGSCLIQNGSFEHGLADWITFAGTEQISKTDAYIGMAALVLSTLDSGTSQYVAGQPGAIYQLTGYGRSAAQDYSSFGMTFFNARGSLLLRSDVGLLYSPKWKDYFTVAIAPTHTASVQVWTYQSSDRGITYIDGLSLKQINAEDIPPTQVSQFALINAPLATDMTFAEAAALPVSRVSRRGASM